MPPTVITRPQALCILCSPIENQISELRPAIYPLETNVCPFANLPEEKRRTQWALTREEMKNCVWLKPELVVQIEFTEWTPDDHLRHAASAVIRQDKNARDVVREAE